MTLDSKGKLPQDLVAIFHASFHPTQGNTIDWSLKANEDLSLENLEFSALPSGLHLVEQDVVYFNKDGHHGVCIFRRRKTVEQGHRGFRLSSLGILLARSNRPRPWKHVPHLKELIDLVYTTSESSGLLQPSEAHWEPARTFFEERKARDADLGGAGQWSGWIDEFAQVDPDVPHMNPTHHLPHLLRILGPSSLVLYKYVLTRRRILIYTLPPVEAACILCQVAADICYDIQQTSTPGNSSPPPGRLKGKSSSPINVLGMVTLTDMDRLRAESETGRGWIACTTDAIYLEKPHCYDLLIDLTTSTPNKATRPTFYASKPVSPTVEPGTVVRPVHRLSSIRFAWSDIRLWNELDRILQLDADAHTHHGCCGPSGSSDAALKSKLASPWTDAWRIYEDVCIICAGLWMGSWRGNSTASYSTANGAENWGKIKLEGDDDFSMTGSMHMRNLGMGIEGRPAPNSQPVASGSGSSSSSSSTGGDPPSQPPPPGLQPPASPTRDKPMRRTSGMSWQSSKAALVGTFGFGKSRQASTASQAENEADSMNDTYEEEPIERSEAEPPSTALALLQTFHAHACFQLSVLESYIPCSPQPPADPDSTVLLAPKDVLAFELGPLSGLDARYLEWLSQEYGGGWKVVVKRGWKDLFGAIFGYT